MKTTQENKSTNISYKNSTNQSQLIVIEREFNVPLQKLFEAFTTPEALKLWWWPKGLYADRVDLDFREGGIYFINMKGYDEGGGGMTGHFEEITQNERIVMTDHFADENGYAITAQEAKMPGSWPEVIYITFDFSTVIETQSSLKLSQQGIPNELQKDCLQGWNESFDKLEKYLKSRKH